MAEDQNTEWKESWRDEYLKWVCGFANARGGRIYIGKSDDGTIVGISDSKSLMEDIPNKIQTTLGIIADVNLLTENGKEYIEIIVSPSSYPVNYHGEYYRRSGSTLQQLRGSSLTEFIREKTGLLWDAVPVDNIGVNDLDRNSIDIFRREAIRNRRMDKEDLNISNEELMDHLDLLVDGKLKRAAVMLFYKKPGRIITGCYVKIGKFGKGADLQYQDLLEGSLFNIADRVIDLIFTKYLKAAITYEHDIRVETFPFPRDGVREAVYNALGHNNYAGSVPIQIRIEDNAMYISNRCILPPNWTAETLMEPHKSVPFNPSIANVFYRAGYIEAWGRGIQKICDSCRELGTSAPEYIVFGNDITVKFTALQASKVSDDTLNDTLNETLNRQDDGLDVGLDVGLAEKTLKIISENPKVTMAEIANECNVTKRTVERTIKALREQGKVVREGGKRYGHWNVI
ncbi:MAG: putative DNA binding domain-containing protein [Clostridiales bacterium]|nr:putative DNA binding domain-containing protein [Clostridiales bacterium]